MKKLIPDSMKTDLEVHYTVNKKDESFVDLRKLINSIIHYVQNHEIYFRYNPTFSSGILIFGIIGFTHDHEQLQKTLSSLMDENNCELTWSDYQSLEGEPNENSCTRDS